jgi:hypothetical protein
VRFSDFHVRFSHRTRDFSALVLPPVICHPASVFCASPHLAACLGPLAIFPALKISRTPCYYPSLSQGARLLIFRFARTVVLWQEQPAPPALLLRLGLRCVSFWSWSPLVVVAQRLIFFVWIVVGEDKLKVSKWEFELSFNLFLIVVVSHVFCLTSIVVFRCVSVVTNPILMVNSFSIAMRSCPS